MRVRELFFGPGGHRLVSLERADGSELPLFTLECGDGVALVLKGGQAADFPHGVVYDREDRTLTVALKETRSLDIETGNLCDVERSTNRFTYRRMLEALGIVRESQAENIKRFRGILLEAQAARKPDPDREPEAFFDAGLNPSQKEAVRKA